MVDEWLVLRTRSRQESVVECNLNEKTILYYLPKKVEARWSRNGKRNLESPIFPGYVFVRPKACQYRELNFIRGSCGLIMFNGKPGTLQDTEVEQIRRAALCGRSLESHCEILVGEKVEVGSGPLQGIQGNLIRFKNRNRIVMNAHILGQSISIEIEMSEVRKVKSV